MKQKIKKLLYRISKTPMSPVLRLLWDTIVYIQIKILHLVWFFGGAKKPNKGQRELMRQNVTFLFKSFERQELAKKLYQNIQDYYPGTNVIIVDDSSQPLELTGPGLQVVQLPFNSGLSAGLNIGLSLVKTPFVVRMDDDELLTPRSNFHRQLEFLLAHPEVDLVGILPMKLPVQSGWKAKEVKMYKACAMSNAPLPLLIPHGTVIDENHTVFGKVPNIFIARTEKYRAVGYDEHIRMIDHHEFFFRAAGNIVSVLDDSCYVLHLHYLFDHAYHVYRMDIVGDKRYIAAKHPGYFSKKIK